MTTATAKKRTNHDSAIESIRQLLATQGVAKLYAVWGGLALLAVLVALNSDKVLGIVDQPIAHFEVSGSFAELSKERIGEAVQPWMGENFLSVDIREIQSGIELLPWVKSATVHRKWPDVVLVELQEQTAVANWGHDAYINNEGEIFRPQNVVRERNRPLLIGPENASQTNRMEMLAYLDDVSDVLASEGLTTDQLSLNERGAWMLGVQDGPVIELGTDPDNYRVQRAIKTYLSLNAEAKPLAEKIDARYTNGVAVRWKDIKVASGFEYSVNPIRP